MPLLLILGGVVLVGAAAGLAVYATRPGSPANPPPAANKDPAVGDPLAKPISPDASQTMFQSGAPETAGEERPAAEPPDPWPASPAATTSPVVSRTVQRAFPDYEPAALADERYGYAGDDGRLTEPDPVWAFDDAAAGDIAQAPNQPGSAAPEWH